MMYPFMTLNDDTEITYSSPIQTSSGEIIRVCFETPIENGFKDAVCILPEFTWENHGYMDTELAEYKRLINSVAHLLIRFSHEGGIESV